MRYKALTNMGTKEDKKSADVLLYLSKCTEAIRLIQKPDGYEVFITVKATNTRLKGRLLQVVYQKHLEMLAQLKEADAAAERASRKRTRCRNTLLKSARSTSTSTPKATKKR